MVAVETGFVTAVADNFSGLARCAMKAALKTITVGKISPHTENNKQSTNENTHEKPHHQPIPPARTDRRSQLDAGWSGDGADLHDPA